MGKIHGSVDILASNGHMRWLQKGAETLPCAWRDWMSGIADFSAFSPFIGVSEITDEGNPCLTRRQCKKVWGDSFCQIVLLSTGKLGREMAGCYHLGEHPHRGVPGSGRRFLRGVKIDFHIIDKEWRGSTVDCPCITSFLPLVNAIYLYILYDRPLRWAMDSCAITEHCASNSERYRGVRWLNIPIYRINHAQTYLVAPGFAMI